MTVAVPQFKSYSQQVDFDPGGNFLQGLETARKQKSQNLKDIYQELVNQGVPKEIAIKQAEEQRKATDFQHEEDFLKEIAGPFAATEAHPEMFRSAYPKREGPTPQELKALELDDELGLTPQAQGVTPIAPQTVNPDLDATLMMDQALRQQPISKAPPMTDEEMRGAAYRNKQFKTAEALAPLKTLEGQQALVGARGDAAYAMEAFKQGKIDERQLREILARKDKPTRGIIGYDKDGNGILINPETGEEISKLGVTRPGKTTMAGQKIIDQSNDLLSRIEQMVGSEDGTVRPHAGFSGSVGAKGLAQLGGLLSEPIAGTPEADFMSLYEQVQGSAFLDAVQTMKGSGALSDTEGKAATRAVMAMRTSQSETGFIKAANEYRRTIKRGIERQREIDARSGAGAPVKGARKTTGAGDMVFNGTEWEPVE